MPVRVAIHSSLVSTMRSRSLLVMTEEGTLLPLPASRQPVSHCRTASTGTHALRGGVQSQLALRCWLQRPACAPGDVHAQC